MPQSSNLKIYWNDIFSLPAFALLNGIVVFVVVGGGVLDYFIVDVVWVFWVFFAFFV